MKKLFLILTLCAGWLLFSSSSATGEMIPFSLERAIKNSQLVVEAKYQGFRKQDKIITSNGMEKMHCPAAKFKIVRLLKGETKEKTIEVIYNLLGRGGCLRAPLNQQLWRRSFQSTQMPAQNTTFLLFLKEKKHGIYRPYFGPQGHQQALPGSLSKETVNHVLQGDKPACLKCHKVPRFRSLHLIKETKKGDTLVVGTDWKCFFCMNIWPADRGEKKSKK